MSWQWHHNECYGVSNHWCLDCLLNCLFRGRSKKTSKLHVTGLCHGNPLMIGGFPSQMVSNVENVSIWWHHHGLQQKSCHWINCFMKIMYYKFMFHYIPVQNQVQFALSTPASFVSRYADIAEFVTDHMTYWPFRAQVFISSTKAPDIWYFSI